MRYLLPVVLFASLVLLVVYVIKAEQIRDRMLSWAARDLGINSSAYRLQEWFTNNALYVAVFRVVAAIAAICVLVVLIYVIRVF